MQALERTLYRSVRRLAQHLDASAARRGALTALPANYYDRQARVVVDMEPVERDADDAARAADDAVDHLVRQANGGSEFYVPGRGEALTAALTRAARDFESDSFDGAELGMAALRRLGRVAALAGAMNSRRGGLRARNPSAALVLDDASPVGVGDVLVAHPMSCLSQPTLHGAVILLVAAEPAPHDDDSFEASAEDPPVLGREGGFVMGLVVNKRSGVTLADAATEHGMAALDSELLASELFVGGDVSSRTLTGVSDVADDRRSGPPKWFTDDVTALESGKSRIFCGYCGWSTAQLENELARGVWFRARAPHTIALEDVEDDAGTSVWRSALSACGFPELADLAVSHTAVLEAFSAVDGPASSSSSSE
jgi:putative AlgH/UPF0301 family transcriptional regulator